MLDTSKTAGTTTESTQQETSEPGFDWLLIASAALALAILGMIVWTIAQNDEAPTAADSVVGFEDNSEATTGKLVTGWVTTQYFGYTDELYPEEGAAAETPVEWTPPEYRADYGDAASATESVTDFEDNTAHTTGKVASEGVTTPYFGFNPEFD